MIYHKPFLLFVFTFLMIISHSETTLTPKSPRSTKDKNKVEKAKSGPQNHTVFTKKFISETPNSKDIINNHGAFFKEVDEFSFKGLVLGYVTPVGHFYCSEGILFI